MSNTRINEFNDSPAVSSEIQEGISRLAEESWQSLRSSFSPGKQVSQAVIESDTGDALSGNRAASIPVIGPTLFGGGAEAHKRTVEQLAKADLANRLATELPEQQKEVPTHEEMPEKENHRTEEFIETGELFEKITQSRVLQDGTVVSASLSEETEATGLENLARTLGLIMDSGGSPDETVDRLNKRLEQEQSLYRVHALGPKGGKPTVLLLLFDDAPRSYAEIPRSSEHKKTVIVHGALSCDQKSARNR